MIVVHYVPFIDKTLGGVSAFIALLARDLGALCELHIVTHKSENDYILQNCQVHYIPNKWKPWDSCKEEFITLLRQLKPDVFHTNGCWSPLRAFTLIWAHEMGIKTVLTPHGMLDPYALNHNYWSKKLPAILAYQRKAVQTADIIHTTAEIEKKNVMKLGWNNKIALIPNCVQVDGIELKGSWSIRRKLVFISRIHHKKGIHFLIDAVARLSSELANHQVIIAGPKENDYYDEMIERTKKSGVDNIIKFVGPVYGQDKWNLYKDSDVFVLPTITENFGIVIAEALACGTPVITSEGAPWEDLESYNCGWWTKIGTESTVEAIQKYLLCTEQDLEEKGRNGQRLVQEKYASTSVAKQFINMYNNL